MARVVVVFLAGLLGLALWSDAAFADGKRRGHHAHRGHHHHGHHHHFRPRIVFYAAPLFVPRYYYPTPVYYARPPAPTVYIEQPQLQPDSQAYWYYCHESQAYYPHVQTCLGGWQRVAPQIPPPG